MSRKVLNALMPDGSIWVPEDDEDLDNLWGGIAVTNTQTQEFLSGLALTRNPQLTPDLEGLELEFGIVPDSNVDETVRRDRLQAAMTSRQGDGTAETMQRNLRAAGFDVFVHRNNPPIDPDLFIGLSPSAIFGNQASVFGNQASVFGGKLGDLVVNGPTYEHVFISAALFGGSGAVFGNEKTLFGAGAFAQKEIEYEVPTDPGYWPLVFFVGGPATRAVDGSLVSIEAAEVEVSRKDELVSLVVKYKPVHSWAGLVIEYI